MYSRDFIRRLKMQEAPLEYRDIKVGVKKLEDATLNAGSLLNDVPSTFKINKPMIYKALAERDMSSLRHISRHYYNLSGIYATVCNYFAFLYRYDWSISPEVYDSKVGTEKVLKDFSKILNYLDNSYLKKKFGEIAQSIIVDGCYYGYWVPSSTGLVM